MTTWTGAEVTFASKLWRRGHSVGDIAKALLEEFGSSRSRQSITGVANRNRDKFPHRMAQAMLPAAPPPAPKPAPIATPPATIECRHVTLMERGPGECCWPTNDGGPFTYCGLPAERGAYCGHHAARLIGLGTVSERQAHVVLAKEAA